MNITNVAFMLDNYILRNDVEPNNDNNKENMLEEIKYILSFDFEIEKNLDMIITENIIFKFTYNYKKDVIDIDILLKDNNSKSTMMYNISLTSESDINLIKEDILNLLKYHNAIPNYIYHERQIKLDYLNSLFIDDI